MRLKMAELLITLLIVTCGTALARSPSAAAPIPTCTQQTYDVHYTLEVGATACQFYQPGNLSARDIHSVYYGKQYDYGGTMVDCFLVNGSFPGPLLRATVGDLVRVDVINNLLDRPVSVHWHGLSMRDYQWADGTSFVTSCPIPAGRNTVYVFTADRAGTYFYHGHTGQEEEYGLSGTIVIDDPTDAYTDLSDEEWPGTSIYIRDWWRAPAGHYAQSHTYFEYEKFDPFGIPMINGFYGNGSDALPTPVINVAVDTCYRMRMVMGNTQWSGWTMSVADRNSDLLNLTVLALTAENLHPVNTAYLSLYVAQRVEFILCTPATPQDLNVTFVPASAEAADEGHPQGQCNRQVLPGPGQDRNPMQIGPNCIDHFNAIFRVGGISATRPKTANRTKFARFPFVSSFDHLVAPAAVSPLVTHIVPSATKTYTLNAGIAPTVTPGYFAANNMTPSNLDNQFLWPDLQYSYGLPQAPYLFTNGQCGTRPPPPPIGTTPHGKDGALYNNVINASQNQVIDFVVNNLSPYMHPLHLHGYRFTVLGSKYIVPAGYARNSWGDVTCPNSAKYADWRETRPAAVAVGAFLASGGTQYFPFFYGCPYNASDPTNAQYMLSKPYTTDVVPLPAHSWVVVRVKFDNPGYWFFHCHILSHMLHGMGFIINAFHDRAPPIPAWVDTSCGGVCKATNQFCGPYSGYNCVQPTPANNAANICTPPGFVPN